jgi:rSAM/selenodomain-associated transferase 1
MRLFVLFARSPYGEGIKTRLAPCCDGPARRRLHHAFVLDSLANLLGAARRHAGQVWFRVASPWPTRAPAGSDVFPLPPWLKGRALAAQVGESFGERLGYVFQEAFAAGYTRVVVVGSDTPLLPGYLIEMAVAGLERVPVVLGPAEDGGYYLIGVSAAMGRPERLFEGIAWGTAQVLAQTQARCAEAGVAPAVLPVYFDIDRCADLARLERDLTGLANPRRYATGRLLRALGRLATTAVASTTGLVVRAAEQRAE